MSAQSIKPVDNLPDKGHWVEDQTKCSMTGRTVTPLQLPRIYTPVLIKRRLKTVTPLQLPSIYTCADKKDGEEQ